jgi:hypothetical protein
VFCFCFPLFFGRSPFFFVLSRFLQPASLFYIILGVVGWFLGARRPKKYKGWSVFLGAIFYRVFELPSPRNTQKRDKQIKKKIGSALEKYRSDG